MDAASSPVAAPSDDAAPKSALRDSIEKKGGASTRTPTHLRRLHTYQRVHRTTIDSHHAHSHEPPPTPTAMSYYFAHASTAPALKTTLGEEPRLLSSGGAGAGEAAPSAPRTERLTKYSFYDDGDVVCVLVDVEPALLAALPADALRLEHGADFVHLTVALADRALSLRLAGLFAPISAARAVKGKSRVTLKLTKAAPAVWTSVVGRGGGAAGADFDDDD